MSSSFASRALGSVLSAALSLPPLPALAEAPAQTPSDASASDASERFTHATKLYKQRQFTDALPLFEALARETNSPNAWLYVGHCRVKLGDPVAAHRAFVRILGNSSAARDDKYDTTREAARAELFALEQKVGKVVVAPAETPPGFAVTLDGEALAQHWFGLAYAVEPGTHRLQATADGMQAELRDVQVAIGETKTVSLALRKPEAAPVVAPAPEPASEPERGGGALRMAGFAALGVGVAGLAVFTVAGLGAKSVHDELDADCPSGCDDAEHRDDAARGKTLQTTANVGLVVGVLGAAGGAALLFFGRSAPAEDGASLALAPGGGSLSFRGRF